MSESASTTALECTAYARLQAPHAAFDNLPKILIENDVSRTRLQVSIRAESIFDSCSL